MTAHLATRQSPAHIDQYLGFWQLEPNRFMRAVELVRAMDVRRHMRESGDFLDRHIQQHREQLEQKREAVQQAGAPAEAGAGSSQAAPPAGGVSQEATRQSVRNGYNYDVIDGVALVTAEGSLMKHASSYDDSTSTAMLRNTLRKMRIDPLVRGAILVIDSPGGTVSGAYDLAEDVEQLAKAKPTYAYGENCLCSAAYLQAAMTRGISVNRNAIVGSIGTYGVVYDYSKLFENEGVKAIVISSGGVKGACVPGTEITDEQIAEFQKEVNNLNGLFIDFVARGRGMDRKRVAELADGKTYVGKEAVKIGLVQRVETLDQLFGRVRQEIGGPAAGAGGVILQGAARINLIDDRAAGTDDLVNHPVVAQQADGEAPTDEQPAEDDLEERTRKSRDNKNGDEPKTENSSSTAEGGDADVPQSQGAAAESHSGGDGMSQQNSGAAPAKDKQEQPAGKINEPKPATMDELDKEFADDPKFAITAYKKGLTLVEAKAEYAEVLKVEKKALEKENAELKESAGGKPVGSKPLSEAGKKKASDVGVIEDGSAVAEFEQRVAAAMAARPGVTREKAAQNVLGADADLRERFNAEKLEAREVAMAEQRAAALRRR